ncbi:hypothetical protein BDF20DRAFT_901499 [Mycotypha africana]|uniref:uncharacterized protein n=1 Tax=Mycotypha africana TaxID=64632 RepID=UPI002300BB19|nr:uncharacterized protein BDF20DRAFT_901499 [Mycotypha africana]KAI8967258.1 hypothetical protein BDF20DRAFT_901499 [Mycotypha africana]
MGSFFFSGQSRTTHTYSQSITNRCSILFSFSLCFFILFFRTEQAVSSPWREDRRSPFFILPKTVSLDQPKKEKSKEKKIKKNSLFIVQFLIVNTQFILNKLYHLLETRLSWF